MTLGDLLYADKTKARVPESDWVGLVRSIARGDQWALHALYTRTHRIVFTLLMRSTGHRGAAEELTLDVFHDVWRRASSYDPAGGSVIGWILNQARTKAIDRRRLEGAGSRDAPAALDATEQGPLLRQALEGLTPHERQAIELAFFSELTYVEAAARLQQPLATVRTRIRTGLAALRRGLPVASKDQ